MFPLISSSSFCFLVFLFFPSLCFFLRFHFHAPALSLVSGAVSSSTGSSCPFSERDNPTSFSDSEEDDVSLFFFHLGDVLVLIPMSSDLEEISSSRDSSPTFVFILPEDPSLWWTETFYFSCPHRSLRFRAALMLAFGLPTE